jgi:hypothetical protein
MREILLSSCVLLFATGCATDNAEANLAARRASQVEAGSENVGAQIGSKGGGGARAASSSTSSSDGAGGLSRPTFGAQAGDLSTTDAGERCLMQLDKADCPCLAIEAGQERECFSGNPTDLLQKTGCKLGKQVCLQLGGSEFKSYAWGACEGQVTVCGTVDAGRDGTTDAGSEGGGATLDLGRGDSGSTTDLGRGGSMDLGRGGSMDLGRGGSMDLGRGGTTDLTGDYCGCPDTVRWCDLPPFCRWGTQTCLPDGMWGPCLEASAGPQGCLQMIFDTACCKRQGLCCAWNNDKLIGDCPANGCPAESAKP